MIGKKNIEFDEQFRFNYLWLEFEQIFSYNDVFFLFNMADLKFSMDVFNNIKIYYNLPLNYFSE